ncbi:hypothetical protein ACFUVV_12940 [Streptomyces sp. NPDC057376]|uniref:hypothetical protein n=1 Tax=unclassified Streptomyces TaxID=2593676 RepID=UPI0009388B07|nr:hypothetical protein [Streptomyces sp. CB02414]OKI85622.1 hypothetical protein AMK11_18710 [Streptomyces sp. CB02414]
MTTDTSEKPVARRQETGWSTARRLDGRGAVRTWIPAVEDGTSARAPRTGQESNIVRGED